MELFTIHCTTCKARLIVKDESVIGDILACPKCQSMVQVVPPPDWKPAVPAPAPHPSAPAVPQGDVAPKAASQPATARPARQPDAPRQTSAKSDSTLKAAAAVPPALPPRHTPPEIIRPLATAASGAVSSAAVPPAGATSNPSAQNKFAGDAAAETSPGEVSTAAAPGLASALLARAKRDWLLLGGGISGGVALGALAWLVVWWQAPRPPAQPESPHPLVAVAPAMAAAERVDANQPVADNTDTATPESGLETVAAASDPSPAPGAEPSPEPEPAAPLAADGAAALLAADQPANQPAGHPTPEQPAPTVAENDADPKPALKLDPVAQNSLPANIAVPALNEFAASATLPEARQLEPAGTPDQPAAAATAAEPPAEALVPVSEIERKLALPISRVEFKDTTLGHFAAFLGDVSGVPVILDEPALAQAGKNRKTKLSLQLTATTALAVLQQGAAVAELTYSIEPGRIVISTPR